MLKILFCFLLLNQFSFADEVPSEDKFSETQLKKKSSSEDNINVVPFYSVKDLKKKGVETVKSEEQTVENMLQDRVSKYKDVQNSLKYFSDLYKANKITNEKALLEFKWALRVLAKRKDAIVRITKNLKDQSKIEAITSAIETSQLESDSERIVHDLESQKIQPAQPRSIAADSKKEIKTVDQIKADQQKAWNFYKNKTYLSVINKNKKNELPKTDIIEPAPLQTEEIKDLKSEIDLQEKKESISEVKEIVPTPMVEVTSKEISNNEVDSNQITEIPAKKIVTTEIDSIQNWKEIVEEKNIESDSLQNVNIVESPSVEIDVVKESPKIEVPEIQELVDQNLKIKENEVEIQATLDLIKQKEQEALQNEYKYQELLNKYNAIVKENEQNSIEAVKSVESDKKVVIEVKKEEPKQLIILDEMDGVQAIDEKVEPVKKNVKINSIQEQFQNEMLNDPNFNGRSDQNDDEVQYYRGNGLEEEGYLEESDSPQY